MRRSPTLASGGNTSAETLIREAHAWLDSAGVYMSKSKVTRLVRDYKNNVEGKGFSFTDFFANKTLIRADERRRALARRQALADPKIARVIAYADPTGETAVNSVMRAAGGTAR